VKNTTPGNWLSTPGEDVVVEAEKGPALGKLSRLPHEKERRFFLKSHEKVLRKATPKTSTLPRRNQQLEKDASSLPPKGQREGPGHELVRTEILLDRSKALFYNFHRRETRRFSGKLVRDLAAELRMRIGCARSGSGTRPRWSALGAAAGSSAVNFLNRFELVSVKMAKEQNLASTR